MNLSALIKKIRNTQWWSAEGPIVFQLINAPCRGFTKISKYFPGLNYWGVMVFLRKDYGCQIMDEKDNLKFVEFLIEKHLKNKNYLTIKIKKWEKLRKKLNNLIFGINKKSLDNISNKKLWNVIEKYYRDLSDLWAISLILEGNGLYFEKYLLPEVKEYIKNKGGSISISDVNTLISSEKLSFSKKEQGDLYKLAREFIVKKVPVKISLADLKNNYHKIYRNLERHQKDYFWLRNNYAHSQEISSEEFLQEIKEIIKSKTRKEIENEISKTFDSCKKLLNCKRTIIKKLGLGGEILDKIKLFSIFSGWQDERKKMNLYTGHYITLLIKEVSRRMRMDYKKGYYLLDDEIKNFLLKNNHILVNKLEERRKAMFFILPDGGRMEIYEGREKEALIKEALLTLKKINSVKIRDNKVRGMVASFGNKIKIAGRIRVVLNAKRDIFKKGEILVTSMTRPEFVPLMRKAKAVITDEGGVTSHAAIVSREMNIPCVIGTKIAAKIFKSGDLIKIDLKKGLIEKIYGKK